jgi:hypothetical protein
MLEFVTAKLKDDTMFDSAKTSTTSEPDVKSPTSTSSTKSKIGDLGNAVR